MPQIISANRLRDGRLVYFDAYNEWVEAIDRAALHAGKEAQAAALARAQAGIKANLVVDVAAIEMEEAGGVMKPVHLRDAIRIGGPTITPGTVLTARPTAPAQDEYSDVSI